MDNLPSKSLSKSILIAIPLFCLILAILDTSDELSYLFILELLDNMAGTPDITFLPSQQPQINDNYQKYQLFQYNGINLMDGTSSPTRIPLVNRSTIEQWAQKYEIIRGVSPRWLVPVVANRIDSLILVSNISNELGMGVGTKSNLRALKEDEIALSSELLGKLSKSVGEKLSLTLSIKNLFNGARLIQKYQSAMSHSEDSLIEEKKLQIQQLSHYIYEFIQQQGKAYNISVSQSEISELAEYIYNLEYQMDYTIKYEYQNKGLYSFTLNDVILMDFNGFSNLLNAILESQQLENILFQQIDKSSLSPSEKKDFKLYFKLSKNTGVYQSQIQKGVYDYPLMMIASYDHRELVYHPRVMKQTEMYEAMENSPGDFQVVAVYPLYQDLSDIRFFFKSVIQIFTFICGVIFFYTMRLILKQVYEEKEIEVGIWRTLGAGGVKEDRSEQASKDLPFRKSNLREKLSLGEKISYGYRMLVKVGFLYYWLFSCLGSAVLYQILKWVLYNSISALFKSQAPPPQYIQSPFIVFFVIFGFTMALIVLHIREIYVSPLVQTIKPVKRTFDVVKVRVIKIATFGITLEVLIIGVMLVYYGVVSYYWIPLSILQDDGDLRTILFNSIFIFMILGSIMVLIVLQSRMECWTLKLFFYFSKYLSTFKLIMLKSIKAKQYKNLKVSLIISLIFAFLLFFTAGIKIELRIVESFTERQVGADLMVLNYEKQTLNRTKIEEYLDTVKGIKYVWLSQNLERDDIKIGFQTITKRSLITSRFGIVTPNYLDVAFFEYYYPDRYDEATMDQLQVLPNGVRNGFTTLYKYDGLYNNLSIGKYNPEDTLTDYDPHCLNVPESEFIHKYYRIPHIPQEEQVINMVISDTVRKKLGANAGDLLKLSVNNTVTGQNYYFRCRITHTFKASPTLDIYSNYAYMTQSQGEYLFKAIGYDLDNLQYCKLLLSGKADLQEIGNHITSISPDHTQVRVIEQVKLSFSLIEEFLNGFVVFITAILALLSILFLAVYTYGKCKEEAEVFKMLRAIGLSVFDIRLMIYLQILIRIVIAIVNGVFLGLMFSLGLAGQVEEILMLKAPIPDLGILYFISFALVIIFSMTVAKSTQYLTQRTVLETSKM